MLNRKTKDYLVMGSIWLAAALVVSILVMVVGFIFANGWPLLSRSFLMNQYEDTIHFVSVEVAAFENLGMELVLKDEGGFVVVHIASDSPFKAAIDNTGQSFPIKKGHIIESINGATEMPEIIRLLNDLSEPANLIVRIRVQGGGVFPMMISTLLLIVVSLMFAAPLGILAAIYMVEYAKQGKVVSLIRFATEILTGIPAVVYGLFGMMMFVRAFQLGTSILAGALTMMILLLPVMMRTTEEALKTVPGSYREASYSLGANKIQTISKVVLPAGMPGIMVGIILAIGRIVGESAALLFTVGTFAQLPINQASGNVSILETGATLTLRAFIEVKEFGNIEMASAIGVIILLIVFVLNITSKLITKRFRSFQG